MTEPQYGPPQGEPIQFSPPPSVAPRRKRWPWILGGVLLVALVLFGGCVYYGVRIYNSPTGAGTVFATAIEQGDNEIAYDSLCAQSKEELTFSEFVESHVPSQDVTSIEPVTLSLDPNDESDVFIVSYVLADGSREVVEYPMVNEQGKWRVCNPPKIE